MVVNGNIWKVTAIDLWKVNFTFSLYVPVFKRVHNNALQTHCSCLWTELFTIPSNSQYPVALICRIMEVKSIADAISCLPQTEKLIN